MLLAPARYRHAFLLVICLGFGLLTLAPAASAAAPLTWLGPTGLDRTAGGQELLLGVSCPSPRRCVAVDQAGQVVRFNPRHPGTPSVTPMRGDFNGVSCADTAHCTAVSDGSETTFDPTHPRAIKRFDVQGAEFLYSVSCTGISLCTAVDANGLAVSFDPATGTTTSSVSLPSDVLMSVSCLPGGNQCTAVDDSGDQYTFAPSSGAVINQSTPGMNAFISTVSCPAANKCFLAQATNSGGNVVRFNPRTSSGPGSPVIQNSSGEMYGLSCAHADCVAVTDRGSEISIDVATAHASNPVTVEANQTLSAVSCPRNGQCTAVDFAGHQVTFSPSGTVLTGPSTVDAAAGSAGTSCPAADQCTSVDSAGAEVTFNPVTGAASAPHIVDAAGRLVGVGCLSRSQCVTVDGSGTEVTFDPTTGAVTSAQPVDSHGFVTALSCWSGTRCTDVDGYNYAVTFDPSGQVISSNSLQSDPNASLFGIACVASSASEQCTAVDSVGHELTFDPTTTQLNGAGVVSTPARALFTVSCPSASQCTAVGHASGSGGGEEVTFDPVSGAVIGSAQLDSAEQLGSVSCPSARQCISADSLGGVITFDPTTQSTGLTPVLVSGAGPNITCISLTECVIADEAGDAYVGLARPTLLSRPTVSGASRPERVLTEHHGRSRGVVSSYAYQWEDCGRRGRGCRAIPGATRRSYRVGSADLGHRIRVVETAINRAARSAPRASAATPIIAVAAGATTLKATRVGRFAATLEGQIATRGQAVKWRFEYGRQPPYTRTRTQSVSAGQAKPVRVSAPLSGLRPGTTYHFRLVVTVSRGAGKRPLITYGHFLTVTTKR
jgi:hypothetical protein